MNLTFESNQDMLCFETLKKRKKSKIIIFLTVSFVFFPLQTYISKFEKKIEIFFTYLSRFHRIELVLQI